MKRTVLYLFLYLLPGLASSQEIQARVDILTNKISSQIDRRVFQTLQSGLTNFINTRKWTTDVFQPAERIQCSFC